MNLNIETLKEMFLVSSDGSSRETCLENLQEHLNKIGIEAIDYYFLEAFSGGKVSGAMALAHVKEEPPRDRKFRTSTVKEGPYLVVDMTYQDYVEDGTGKKDVSKVINNYIKEQGYSLGGFPFFKFVPDLDSPDIKVYVPLR